MSCTQLSARGQHPIWSADEQTIYYVAPVEADIQLWAVDLCSGEQSLLKQLGPTHSLGPFVEVTADGQALWVRYLAGQTELWRLNH